MFTNKLQNPEENFRNQKKAENDPDEEIEKIGIFPFTEEGLNHRKMSHDLWTYYRRLERLIEKNKLQTTEGKKKKNKF